MGTRISTFCDFHGCGKQIYGTPPAEMMSFINSKDYVLCKKHAEEIVKLIEGKR